MFEQAIVLISNALFSGALYALSALALTLTYSYCRIINFAHGQLLVVGAYLSFLACELGFLWLLPIVLPLSAILLARFVWSLALAPLASSHSMLTFLSTFAVGILLESLILAVFGPESRVVNSALSSTNVFLGVSTQLFILIILSLLALALSLLFLRHSLFGKRALALSEQPEALATLSISSEKLSQRVFTLSVFLALVAGAVFAFEVNVDPRFGVIFTIKALAIVMVAGRAQLALAVFCAFTLAILETAYLSSEFVNQTIGAGYRDAITFSLIVICLLFFPNGLRSSKKRAV